MKPTRYGLLLLLLFFGIEAKAQNQVTVTDASIDGTANWTADTVYLLDGYVYVEDGEILNITAGTVIKAVADPTTGDQQSALIVARGGTINATGTAEAPIIFTSEDDNVTDPIDLTINDRGLWGGILILGNAPINVGTGENYIEGLPQDDNRNLYGGTAADDNSGVFQYVSIRHGGAIFGQDNEINGLTMGGVGSGTTIDHVEVFANQDDGFEWFGGTVDTKYLVAAFCGDDMFDYDEGFSGDGQFWFGIQATDDAGSGGEHDGGTDPETGTPYAIPVIYNATYIGSGSSSTLLSNDFALTIDDNAGGKYYNSIFTEFAGAGVTIEDLATGEDSRARLEAGDLVLSNNIWFSFGNVNAVPVIENTGNVFTQQFVADAFADQNFIVDPQLKSIDRTADGNALDPRPMDGSPALAGDNLAAYPADNPFFTEVDYIGAFGGGGSAALWIRGWTALSENNFVTGIDQISQDVPEAIALRQNYPNPFNPSTTIEYQLEQAQQVRLSIYDVLGREVAVLAEGVQPAGTFHAGFDASGLASGIYLYKLQTKSTSLTRTMTLLK